MQGKVVKVSPIPRCQFPVSHLCSPHAQIGKSASDLTSTVRRVQKKLLMPFWLHFRDVVMPQIWVGGRRPFMMPQFKMTYELKQEIDVRLPAAAAAALTTGVISVPLSSCFVYFPPPRKHT